MLRWFHKYQKIILVVGGSLLMVVFLIPGADMFMPTGANQPIGEVDGITFTAQDSNLAGAELELLTRIGRIPPEALPDDPVQWMLLLHEAQRNGIYTTPAAARARWLPGADIPVLLSNLRTSEPMLDRALQHLDMYLQHRQLVQSSMWTSEPRLRRFTRDVSSQATIELVAIDPRHFRDQIDPPTEPEILAHFEKYKDVAPGESEPYGFGYRLPPRVKIEYLSVPLRHVADVVEIDEIDAVRYYNQHRFRYLPETEKPKKTETDDKTGAEPEREGEAPTTTPDADPVPDPGDTPPATSETQPEGDATPPPAPDSAPAPAPAPAPATDSTDADDRVDPAPAEAESPPAESTEPANTDPAETPHAPAETPDAPDAPDAPADSPDAPKYDPNEPLPYEAVRERVMKDLRDLRARELQQQIVEEILATIQRSEETLKLDTDGYRVVPDDWQPMSFKQVADEIESEHGVLVTRVRLEDQWRSPDEISDLDEIGMTSASVANRPIPIADYIRAARELKIDVEPWLAALRLQEDIVSRPVYDGRDNAFIFRIVDARPAEAPEAIADVRPASTDSPGGRERVAEDLRRLRGYELLTTAKADELLAEAREQSLVKLAERFETEPLTIGPFARLDQDAMRMKQIDIWMRQQRGLAVDTDLALEMPALPIVGQSASLLDAVFAVARRAADAGGVNRLEEPQRFGVAGVPGRQLLTVFKLVEYEPIDRETYAETKGQLWSLMLQTERQRLDEDDLEHGPLSREALAARLGYVSASDRDDEELDEAPDAASE